MWVRVRVGLTRYDVVEFNDESAKSITIWLSELNVFRKNLPIDSLSPLWWY